MIFEVCLLYKKIPAVQVHNSTVGPCSKVSNLWRCSAQCLQKWRRVNRPGTFQKTTVQMFTNNSVAEAAKIAGVWIRISGKELGHASILTRLVELIKLVRPIKI